MRATRSILVGGRRNGFTLIEAVMICVLLSVLAVLVAPKISGYYAESRLRGLSRRIVWHLRLCRQLAISRRLTHWVVFNVSGNSYALYEEREDMPGRENRISLSYLTAEFESEVDVERDYPGLSLSAVDIGGNEEVGFNSLGTPLDMNEEELLNDGSVATQDGAGRSTTVSIASRTGKVFVQ